MTAAGKSQTPGNVALQNKQEGAELLSVKHREKRRPCKLRAGLLSLSGLNYCAGIYLLICGSLHPLFISICPRINPFISFLFDKHFCVHHMYWIDDTRCRFLCQMSSGPLSLHLSALHVPVWLPSVNEILSEEAPVAITAAPTSRYLNITAKQKMLIFLGLIFQSQGRNRCLSWNMSLSWNNSLWSRDRVFSLADLGSAPSSALRRMCACWHDQENMRDWLVISDWTRTTAVFSERKVVIKM